MDECDASGKLIILSNIFPPYFRDVAESNQVLHELNYNIYGYSGGIMITSRVYETPYSDYEKLRITVISILIDLIKRSRGTCVTFTGKKIVLMAGFPPQPVLLTVVKSILEELRQEKLIEYYSRSSHGVKYIVTRDSPLWQVIKNGDITVMPETALCSLIINIVKNRR
ncbi:MAG: hypothetical protein DRJ47_03015 [Thermoprotei archaeon]|nr:MAG: hypothetical protein DRJ47_03015 [Thermoprotei archaeon]